MLYYPDIDPVLIQLGPLKVHWYGVMYLLGFSAAWLLGRQRAQRHAGWQATEIGDLVLYGAIGAVLGGRLGYALFYNLPHYIGHPLDIVRLWEGGMSFHGGLVGVLLALWLYARRSGRSFLQVGDFVAPLVPLGLLFGRLGNFINQELWGRTTDLPWGMLFPLAGSLPRHPSQLYEAALEGLLLFAVLWVYSRQPRPTGRVSGLFLVGYASVRFLVEFTREPDAHLGFIALDWMTMGQLLSLPMALAGLALIGWSGRQGLDHQAQAGRDGH